MLLNGQRKLSSAALSLSFSEQQGSPLTHMYVRVCITKCMLNHMGEAGLVERVDVGSITEACVYTPM